VNKPVAKSKVAFGSPTLVSIYVTGSSESIARVLEAVKEFGSLRSHEEDNGYYLYIAPNYDTEEVKKYLQSLGSDA
jgi:hypothetical protein